ncbi:MAG: chromosomal replication initiator protein DnaA [Dehalococcoidales bacterium]|nr:chromosomal replication initiator protein DnaA [Dehalococcoidales bacterium]
MGVIPSLTPQEIWEAALGELQLQLSRPNFRTWLAKTVGMSYQDKTFVIGVPNAFAAEYLEKNQRSLIEKTLRSLTEPDVRVVFQVNGRSHASDEVSPEAVIPPPPPVFMRLNPNYVFDTFVEGEGNRLARAAAITVAKHPGQVYNPLFIYGGVGLGKTHLLHAIGHIACASHINVICTSAEQFTNEFLSALRERNTEEFRNKYRSIGMLLIDDIQFIAGKEQTEESFFHTFNELHNTNRQIVITSDCPPQAMHLLQERLRSRFAWGLTVSIEPPDYATRLAILHTKAAQKGLTVPQDVLEFIASREQDNIRLLEGSLNRVIAYAKLLRVAPTLETAARALEDIGSREHPTTDLTPAVIIDAVSRSFNLTRDDLLGRRRDKDTILARQLAMYLMRRETNYSLSRIGQELGNRDAAAVTHACKHITAHLQDNPFIRRKLDEIAGLLRPKSHVAR